MTRYILIDDGSGYIWGDSAAPEHGGQAFTSALEYACALDESLGTTGLTYEGHGPNYRPNGSPAYHAHEAPDAFPLVFDGQDGETIDAVQALPKVAVVTFSGPAF